MPVASEQGLGAVMPRADGDAHTVEERAEVEGVDLPYAEGEDPPLPWSLAENKALGELPP